MGRDYNFKLRVKIQFVHIRILLSDTYSYDQLDKMATQSQGIKRLMAAEKEAAQVVANARKSESRLKQLFKVSLRLQKKFKN